MGIQERKVREKEHRREEILDAAQKIFFEKGLVAATMDEIAEQAELSKGTLYLYYRSKEDLYLAIFMRGQEVLYELFRRVIEAGGPVPRVLARLGDAYIEYFERYRSYFRMMRFFETPEFHRQVSTEMRDACDVVNQRIWDLVIGFLRRGIEEGLLRRSLDPVEIAVIFWSSATSLMIRADAEEHEWHSRMGIDLSSTLRRSNTLFLESVLTGEGKAEVRDLLLPS